jgi:hypothetical protein
VTHRNERGNIRRLSAAVERRVRRGKLQPD